MRFTPLFQRARLAPAQEEQSAAHPSGAARTSQRRDPVQHYACRIRTCRKEYFGDNTWFDYEAHVIAEHRDLHERFGASFNAIRDARFDALRDTRQGNIDFRWDQAMTDWAVVAVEAQRSVIRDSSNVEQSTATQQPNPASQDTVPRQRTQARRGSRAQGSRVNSAGPTRTRTQRGSVDRIIRVGPYSLQGPHQPVVLRQNLAQQDTGPAVGTGTSHAGPIRHSDMARPTSLLLPMPQWPDQPGRQDFAQRRSAEREALEGLMSLQAEDLPHTATGSRANTHLGPQAHSQAQQQLHHEPDALASLMSLRTIDIRHDTKTSHASFHFTSQDRSPDGAQEKS